MCKATKKGLSLVLVIAFMLTFCLSSFAGNNSSVMADSSLSSQQLIQSIQDASKDLYAKYPDLEEINNRTIKLLQKGTEPKDIINKISQDDLKKLRNAYKEIDLAAATGNSFEDSIYGYLESQGYNAEEYIRRIEERANQYYEYYKQHNEFPLSSNESNNELNAAAETYDPALLAMGYYVTSAVLSEQLATLTSICATAFPYIALIALLAGATILTAVIIYDYVEYYSDVNDQVIDWYGTSCREHVLKSSADTQSLVNYRVLYGIKYWEAFLVDFAGLGGIAVTEPLTLSAAVARLTANTMFMNTYAVSGIEAADAAAGASIGGSPIMNSAHTSGGRILNKPHYHPSISGQPSASHSFYGL